MVLRFPGATITCAHKTIRIMNIYIYIYIYNLPVASNFTNISQDRFSDFHNIIFKPGAFDQRAPGLLKLEVMHLCVCLSVCVSAPRLLKTVHMK